MNMFEKLTEEQISAIREQITGAINTYKDLFDREDAQVVVVHRYAATEKATEKYGLHLWVPTDDNDPDARGPYESHTIGLYGPAGMDLFFEIMMGLYGGHTVTAWHRLEQQEQTWLLYNVLPLEWQDGNKTETELSDLVDVRHWLGSDAVPLEPVRGRNITPIVEQDMQLTVPNMEALLLFLRGAVFAIDAVAMPDSIWGEANLGHDNAYLRGWCQDLHANVLTNLDYLRQDPSHDAIFVLDMLRAAWRSQTPQVQALGDTMLRLLKEMQ